MMESAAKKLVRNLRPKQRLPPANIAPEGHATWKASSKTTEEPNASDLQLLSPQSINAGDLKPVPRHNKPLKSKIQTGSRTSETDAVQLPETGADVGAKQAKPKVKPTLPTRVSVRKMINDDKKLLKIMEATPIYSKISRASMIKRLRAFEAIDSGRLTTWYDVQKQFDVTGRQIGVWIHKREMIEREALDDKNLMELRKTNNFPVEVELTKYCIRCLEQKQDITKQNLLIAACKIAEKMKFETFVASPLWMACFLMRNSMAEVQETKILKCNLNKLLAKSSTKAHMRSSIKMPHALKRSHRQSSVGEVSSSQEMPQSKMKKPELIQIEEDPLFLPEPTVPLQPRPPRPCRFCLANVNEVGGTKMEDFGFSRLKHWVAQHIGFLITPVANEDEYSEFLCYKCINIFVRWMGCFGDISSNNKWHPHEIKSWTSMRLNSEVSTQTANLDENERGAGKTLNVPKKKIKTEPTPFIKQEPVEEVVVQLMDLQDLPPDPIVQSDTILDTDQTEDPLNNETGDPSLDGCSEIDEIFDVESNDSAPEVVGFAAPETDYISEETLDASGVLMCPAEHISEVPIVDAQHTDKEAEVTASKPPPLFFVVAKPSAVFTIPKNTLNKSAPQASAAANQNTKKLLQAQIKCVTKLPANVILSSKKFVTSAEVEKYSKKFIPSILQKKTSPVKVLKVITPSPQKRKNISAALGTPLLEGRNITPAIRNDAAGWKKKCYLIMSNLLSSISTYPDYMKVGRQLFYIKVKFFLNDLKARLMASKYKTPFEFATDFRIGLNKCIKFRDTDAIRDKEQMLECFEVEVRPVLVNWVAQLR